ncbi:hypothetical protein [Janthinobacterium sp. 17J80-10]|uniref:hypothetical protein n=1 Tax=Janthinobacterium sp. 17J80-10 TaxID=2497863 RepID=UPI00100528BB|nr:hypothetical protein [Janthinobacterium sp. 17J80-10]QAU32936.1 hypothetical protein EKL02_01405 [Janthinobacterium sp. 17J80-10]
MLNRIRAWFAGWGLVGLSLLLVAGILGGTALYLSRLRAESIALNLTISELYALTFEEHLSQTFNAIDLTLTNVFDANQLPADSSDLSRQISAVLRHAPYLRSLSLVDATGRIVASSNARNLGLAVNFGDYLRRQARRRKCCASGVRGSGAISAMDIQWTSPTRRLLTASASFR